LAFANGSQYGNNAFIAPGASIFDGLLNVTQISPFPFLRSGELIYRLLNQKLKSNRFCKM
jgi:diacylglycerol kinase family enzyme